MTAVYTRLLQIERVLFVLNVTIKKTLELVGTRYLDALILYRLRHDVTLLGWCFPVGNQEPLRTDCGQGPSDTPSPGRKRGVNPATLPAWTAG